MSVLIHAAEIIVDPNAGGSRERAVRAGRQAIAAAGITPNQLDLLVNVGVYRDSNIVEPANAALIQSDLGMHHDYLPGSGHYGFSFDLRNGPCGVLNAIQAISGLLATGAIDRALIVAADSHPGGPEHEPAGFRYATVGSAMLLGRGPVDGAGFGAVSVPGSPQHDPAAHPGVAGYLPLKSMGTEGQRTITVDVAPDYADMVFDAASSTLTAYLDTHPVVPQDTVLVTNNPAPDLAEGLGAKFGFGRVFQANTGDRDAGSSGLIIAYHQLQATGVLAPGSEILLLAAGSGPIAGCVRYRVPGD